MKVIEFLNTYGLQKLQDDFSIKVSVSEDYPNLYVLNYNQIDSPKAEPVVKECRSLVVTNENGEWEIVSAAFDRFFNYGECDYQPDIQELVCYEKVDGSLVSVFNYKGNWLYRTKSMIMPTNNVNALGVTWDEFIEDCLDWDNLKEKLIDIDTTYIFEVCGEANRVVVKYPCNTSYLLATRCNKTLKYYESGLDFQRPESFNFKSTQDCMNAVKNLPNLEEGYVAYSDGVPVCKIKSPTYVAAHRIKGEGLTPVRIMELVVMNEQDEYLAVFPEDSDKFVDYLYTWNTVVHNSIDAVWYCCRDIEDQKEFAISVKDYPFSSVLFQARKSGSHPFSELNRQRDSFKIKLLTQMMEK